VEAQAIAPDPGVAFELRNTALADSEAAGGVADAGTERVEDLSR
jgi:hypothetical protein